MAAEILQSGRTVSLRVTGSSMLPALWPADLVRVVPLANEPRIGDIVLFQRGGQFVIHRVIRVSDPSQITTRGDSMIDPDEPVAASGILGRVTSVSRNQREFATVTKPGLLQKVFGHLLGRFNLLSRIALKWHGARRMKSGLLQVNSEGVQ